MEVRPDGIVKTIIVGVLIIGMIFLGLILWGIGIATNTSDDEGSMMPYAMEGETFLYIPISPKKIVEGDVIVFRQIQDDGEEVNIIHRVQKVEQDLEDPDFLWFITKGDNHFDFFTPDSGSEIDGVKRDRIGEDSVKGKVVAKLHNYQLLGAIRRADLEKKLVFFLLVLSFGFSAYIFNLHQSFRSWFLSNKVYKFDLKIDRAKVKQWILDHTRGLILIGVLLIPIMWMPLLLFPDISERGTDKMDYVIGPMVDHKESPAEGTQAFVIYQVTIELTITYQPFKRIDELSIRLTDPDGKLVAKNKWTPLGGTIWGHFKFGISLVILEEDMPENIAQYDFFIELKIKTGPFTGWIIDHPNKLDVCSFEQQASCDKITTSRI